MKTLRQLLLISLFALSFVSVGRVAAASQCPTGYTGPDGNGVCTSTTLYACELGYNRQEETTYATIAENNLVVRLEEVGDGQGGFAGSATSNGVTFTVTSPDYESCYVTATTQATEVVEPAPSPAPTPVQPTVLADTNSGNNIVAVLVIASSAATITYLLAAAAKRAKR